MREEQIKRKKVKKTFDWKNRTNVNDTGKSIT